MSRLELRQDICFNSEGVCSDCEYSGAQEMTREGRRLCLFEGGLLVFLPEQERWS